MASEAPFRLPEGDYVIVRNELRSGRVMLVVLPTSLTAEESAEATAELGGVIRSLDGHAYAPPGMVGREVN